MVSPMILLGLEFLQSALSQPGFCGKMVFNANGAIFFPVKREHREMKATGVSYEDDYRGNALAAMLAVGRIEVRFHKAFSDIEVARVLTSLQARPELQPLATWARFYQGRPV